MDETPANKSPQKKVTIWNKTFICILITNTCLVLSQSSVNTLVSTYATFLGAGAVLVGFLAGMFFAVSLAMRPISGPVTTKVDRRILMISVFALGGFVNLGYALFNSIPMFMFFRFFHGLQYSIIGSLVMTIAGDCLPPEKMASGMGIYGVGGSAAAAVAPSIGIGILHFGTRLGGEMFGFRLVFLFASAILFLAVIPSAMISSDKEAKARRADTGVWYKNIFTVYALPVTIVMTLLSISYALFSNYMVPFSVENNIPGISAFFTVQAITMIITRPASGRLADRIGVAKIMMPSFAIFACSFFIVGFSKSLTPVLIGAVIAALGYGSSQPAIQTMCLQTVVPAKRSVASNTLYAGIDLGNFLGPFIGGIVYDHSSYSVMYRLGCIPVILSMICFAIILPSFMSRRQKVAALTAAESGPQQEVAE